MLYALTSAYTRKDYENEQNDKPLETNIGKLLSLFAWGLDLIHEQADKVKLWDDLNNARGAVLDRYGANFGVKRGGANDALYRLLIRVKMIAQLSGGDEDTIIKAAAELLGVEYTDLKSDDVFPAKKFLYVDQVLLSEERLELIEQIAYAIKRAMAAGVGLRLYLCTYHVYVLPIQISHGAATSQNTFFQPVGQPRLDIAPLPINYGAEISYDMSPYEPVGQNRNVKYPFPISRGSEISYNMQYYPIEQKREVIAPLPFSHGTEISYDVSYSPIGKKRETLSSLPINHGAALTYGATYDIEDLPPDDMILDSTYSGIKKLRHNGMYFDPVGQERKSTVPIPVKKATELSYDMKFDPVGQSRNAIDTIYVKRNSEMLSTINVSPVNKKRSDTLSVDISKIAMVPTELQPDIVVDDLVITAELSLGQGNINNSKPRISSNGKTVVVSHIKPRRIE